MSEKQRLKHIADREAEKAVPEWLPISSSLLGVEPTADGLGQWNGGRSELKGVNNWVNLKSKPNQSADLKHAPGTDYPSKIGPEQQKDYVAPLLVEESDNVPCDQAVAGTQSE